MSRKRKGHEFWGYDYQLTLEILQQMFEPMSTDCLLTPRLELELLFKARPQIDTLRPEQELDFNN